MTHFKGINTLEELKKAYRLLAMKNHPDKGGDVDTMKSINKEYEELFKKLSAENNSNESPEEFREIIEKLLKLDGLEVELCGSWLWIGGNTKENKEQLKAAGCRWSSKKKLWYWRSEENAHFKRRGGKEMSEIRAKYGSQVFKGKNKADRLAIA